MPHMVREVAKGNDEALLLLNMASVAQLQRDQTHLGGLVLLMRNKRRAAPSVSPPPRGGGRRKAAALGALSGAKVMQRCQVQHAHRSVLDFQHARSLHDLQCPVDALA